VSAPDEAGFSVTRREVLKGLAALLGASALPACDRNPAVDPSSLPETAADLAEVARLYFGDDLQAARAVGEAYLGEFAEPEVARADLEATFSPLADEPDAAAVASELDAASLRDFEGAVLTSLYGWQLGTTELRVAAVARLTA
jgi:hypothetical protein